MLKKIMTVSIILAVLAGGLAVAKDKVPNVTVNFGCNMITRSLDPIKLIAWEEQSLARCIYDTLVVYNPGNPDKPLPGVAAKWDINADASQYTFYLRKGVKFHTGRELTATDVVESMKRGMRANFPTYMPFAYFMDAETAFTVVDKYTVRMKLKVPYGGLLQILMKPHAGIVDITELNKHITSDDPLGSNWINDHSLGSGPFKLKEWSRDERITLEANEDYWGFAVNDPRTPKYKYFVEVNVPNITTQKLMLEKGDIDVVTSLTNDMIKEYEAGKNKDIRVESCLTYLATSFLMNTGKPPFDDPKVRQAVRYALDYDTLVGKILSAIRMDRPLYKPMIGTDNDILYKLDLAKAKKLMAESKYPNGADFEYCIGTGVGLGAQWEDTGAKIKEDLEKIGLKAKILQVDWSVMDEKMYGGNFVAMENWYGANYPEAEGMMSMIVRHNSNCLRGMADTYDFAPVEKLADAALKTSDSKQRYALYRKISEIFADNGPVAFIGQQTLKVPFRSNVHGWDKNPDYYIYDWAKLYKD